MFTEIKYLNFLSTRLPKFKHKKEFLWNFRCPICGDSQRNKNKARGFVFQVKGKLALQVPQLWASSCSFDRFLEGLDPSLYKEYRLEKFQEGRTRKPVKLTAEKVGSTPVFTVDILDSLTPLDNLNNSHPAKEYILNRKLPTNSLYFTESFQEWTNSVKPETFPEVTQDEGRIIIPFRDKEGNTFAYQGRSLSSTGLRYITILLQEGKPKIFGLDTVDYERTIYIVEGPLDSLLLNNSVAMAGADVSSVPDYLGKDIVFVLDNEPRNPHITQPESPCTLPLVLKW